MTAPAEAWPDADGAIRDFLRADPGIDALVDGRVFFGGTRSGKADNYPQILITRIGGGQATGETPLDNAYFQFDVLGDQPHKGGTFTQVSQVTIALKAALSRIRGKSELRAGVYGFDARIASEFYSPLPADDRPRKIVTAVIPMIAVE